MRGELKWIEIDLGAVASNLRWTLSRLPRGASLMAVVKADAYGHGAERIAAEAVRQGASSLGVLTVDEARRLRAAGVRAPVHLLAPILPDQAAEAVRLRLTPTVDSPALARALNAAAPRSGLSIEVDVDSGLGRWGLAPRDLPEFLASLRRLPRLKPTGLSTHIDYLPGKNAVEAETKLQAFGKLAAAARRVYPSLVRHAANSSILLDFPDWCLDRVRVGNLLYGVNPAGSRPAPLKNPWKFLARIISLHQVSKGRPIGYASEYIAPRRMTVATLPVGYSDGLTMEPAERLIGFGGGFQYWGILRGKKVPFVGRCGISHVMVDVTGVPGARVGEAVALPIRRTAAGRNLPRHYGR